MDRMLLPFRRYATFTGRAPRSEYWSFVLLIAIVYGVALLLLFLPYLLEQPNWEEGQLRIGMLLLFAFNLVCLLPGLAVAVRRLHDINRSGVNLLLMFVPIVGPVVLLAFCCLPGTVGENRYGPDPQAAGPGLSA